MSGLIKNFNCVLGQMATVREIIGTSIWHMGFTPEYYQEKENKIKMETKLKKLEKYKDLLAIEVEEVNKGIEHMAAMLEEVNKKNDIYYAS